MPCSRRAARGSLDELCAQQSRVRRAPRSVCRECPFLSGKLFETRPPFPSAPCLHRTEKKLLLVLRRPKSRKFRRRKRGAQIKEWRRNHDSTHFFWRRTQHSTTHLSFIHSLFFFFITRLSRFTRGSHHTSTKQPLFHTNDFKASKQSDDDDACSKLRVGGAWLPRGVSIPHATRGGVSGQQQRRQTLHDRRWKGTHGFLFT